MPRCVRIPAWPDPGLAPRGRKRTRRELRFSYEAEGRSHLYDFKIFDVTFLKQNASLCPQNILFDKAGLLAEASKRTPTRSFNPADLLHQIHVYWVYAYLNGKYYKRDDVYKMLYVQQVIFPAHLRVLNALYPDRSGTGGPATCTRYRPKNEPSSLCTSAQQL